MTGFEPGQNKKISQARFKAPEIFEFIIYLIPMAETFLIYSYYKLQHKSRLTTVPFIIRNDISQLLLTIR